MLVCDDADLPVAGAIVDCLACATQRHDGELVWLGRAVGPTLQSVITSADGRCDLAVDRTHVMVSARHPDFGQSPVRMVERWPDPQRSMRLWLARPVLVRGRVVDAALQPAPFAEVAVAASPAVMARHMLQTRADDRGEFAFEIDVGTRCELVAEAGERRTLPVLVVVRDGAEIVLALPGGIDLCGRVVGSDGQPGADALVTAMPLAGSDGRSLVQLIAGADGTFTVPLATFGSWRVSAIDELRCEHGETTVVAATPQQPHAPVELRLAPLRPIRGHVRSATGAPVVGAEVSDFTAKARTGSDGEFDLQTPARACRLTAAADGRRATIDVAASGTQDVEIVLPAERDGAVRGEVVADADGRPVVEVAVSWTPPQHLLGASRHGDGRLRRDGNRFAAEAIPAGEGWCLRFEPKDPALAAVLLGPLARQHEEQWFQVRLPQAGAVTVRVVDAGGRGLRSLLVHGEDPSGIRTVAQRTDAEGRVPMAVAPGRNCFIVRRAFEELARREVDVVSGANAELVVQVQL